MPYMSEDDQPKYFYINGEPGPDYCLVIDAVVDKFTGTVTWPDGYKEWWVDGKRHRLDGPACEWPNGHKEWWIDDKQVRYQ